MLELIYITHGKPLPEGFERTGGLEGTHHGKYADIAVRDIDEPILTHIPGHGYVR